MGKASAGKRDVVPRQQIAAQRAAARRAQVRNRMLLASGAIITVVAIALALVLIKVNSKPAASSPPADGPAGAALASVVKDLTSVPASVLDTVRAGSLSGAGIGSVSTSGSGYLAPVSGSPLTSGGKPEVLYLGAGFCPYCAAVRWPLIVALSRFGTFSGLRTTRSAIANGAGQHEPYPATPTWTFHGSRYTSQYLTFTPVELQTNIPDPETGGYRPRPATNSRRRPYRSPSVAPVSSSTANVSVYALTVHCSPSSEACRWSRIDGSAVVTTRLSSDVMNSAIDVTTKVHTVRRVALISCLPLLSNYLSVRLRAYRWRPALAA